MQNYHNFSNKFFWMFWCLNVSKFQLSQFFSNFRYFPFSQSDEISNPGNDESDDEEPKIQIDPQMPIIKQIPPDRRLTKRECLAKEKDSIKARVFRFTEEAAFYRMYNFFCIRLISVQLFLYPQIFFSTK